MSKIDDVLLVSAWGRGAWLLQALKEEFLKMSVLDFSSLLPTASSSEKEGPFGVFVPEDLTAHEKKYLYGDDYYPISQGFCVFTPKGPVEFRGAMDFMKKKCQKQYHLLQSMAYLKASYSDGTLSSIKNVVNFSKESKSKTIPLQGINRDLFSPYIYREFSGRFVEDTRHDLETNGVHWFSPTQILDLSFNKKQVCVTTNHGEHRAKTLVWMLSGPETLSLIPDIDQFSLLFSKKWKKPQWIWKRFCLTWDLDIFKGVIPFLMLVVPEPEKLWMGSNAISIKHNPMSMTTDMWVLCPYSEYKNKAQLLLYQKQSLDKLQALFPYFSITSSELDLNSQHEYFIKYESRDLMKFLLKRPSCLFHWNPEFVGQLDACSLLRGAMLLKNTLLKFLRKGIYA